MNNVQTAWKAIPRQLNDDGVDLDITLISAFSSIDAYAPCLATSNGKFVGLGRWHNYLSAALNAEVTVRTSMPFCWQPSCANSSSSRFLVISAKRLRTETADDASMLCEWWLARLGKLLSMRHGIALGLPDHHCGFPISYRARQDSKIHIVACTIHDTPTTIQDFGTYIATSSPS